MQRSSLIKKYLPQLQSLMADKQSSMLDLACGGGRNGLYLVGNNIPVTFADIKVNALEQVKQSLNGASSEKQQLAQYWQVDFEQSLISPLQGKSFASIMVFRYLHRPLFEQIKAAIKPSGMIIYETFTEQQARYGRPKNPDFLLRPGELLEQFSNWRILHSFEGVINTGVNGETKQAIAQIVAIKPS